MTPIQMCHAWQMRANANAATTAAIFVSKAVNATKVGAMASSQLCSCMQEGLITPFAKLEQNDGEETAIIVVRRDSVDVAFDENLRLMRKANYEESWKRNFRGAFNGRLQRLGGELRLESPMQIEDVSAEDRFLQHGITAGGTGMASRAGTISKSAAVAGRGC